MELVEVTTDEELVNETLVEVSTDEVELETTEELLVTPAPH